MEALFSGTPVGRVEDMGLPHFQLEARHNAGRRAILGTKGH